MDDVMSFAHVHTHTHTDVTASVSAVAYHHESQRLFVGLGSGVINVRKHNINSVYSTEEPLYCGEPWDGLKCPVCVVS